MQPSGNPPDFDEDFLGRLRDEFYCFYLVFRFHDGNNHLRKALTIMLVFVWGVTYTALTLSSVPSVEPPFYVIFTAFVWTIIGKMWNIEFNNFAGGVIESSGGDAEDDDGGDEP